MTSSKILVADDDRDVVKLVSGILRRAGYTVVCAYDGYQAIKVARENVPDLMLLDVNMPAGKGTKIQEKLAEVGGPICDKPILYLTGDQSDRIRHEALRQGVRGIVYKPFDANGLIEAVEAALSEQAAA